MSHLLTKSMQNLESADILINANMFSASVHCSYYSCLQLIKHVLTSDLGMTIADIEKMTAGKSSHNAIINRAYDALLYYKLNEVDAINLRTNISKLKMQRIKADYSADLTELLDSKICYETAHQTILIIHSNFSI
ncbi:MAG: hypothetical protein ACOYOA_05180 [Saprospiraceae bacterium]